MVWNMIYGTIDIYLTIKEVVWRVEGELKKKQRKKKNIHAIIVV